MYHFKPITNYYNSLKPHLKQTYKKLFTLEKKKSLENKLHQLHLLIVFIHRHYKTPFAYAVKSAHVAWRFYEI